MTVPAFNCSGWDSLSDWFPGDLYPKTNLAESRDWETSAGMLRRLKLFDRTQPETIVMIGINDLLEVTDETILENQRQMSAICRFIQTPRLLSNQYCPIVVSSQTLFPMIGFARSTGVVTITCRRRHLSRSTSLFTDAQEISR